MTTLMHVLFLIALFSLLPLIFCNPSGLVEQAAIYPSNGSGSPGFGYSVAFSSSGSLAFVGAPGDDTVGNNVGAVLVFELGLDDLANWMHLTTLYPSVFVGQRRFGVSLALSSNSTRVIIGANGASIGRAYVFDHVGGDPSNWTERAVLDAASAQQFFGYSVALSPDGTRALVGAPFDGTITDFGGSARVFDQVGSDPANWTSRTILYPRAGITDLTLFGTALALSSEGGTQALISAYFDHTVGDNAGSVYVFEQVAGDPSNWTRLTIIYPNNDTDDLRFGIDVDLTSDGMLAIIGTEFAGVVFVYEPVDGNWSNWAEIAALRPSKNGSAIRGFGYSVDITPDGTRALIGAPFDDTLGNEAGSAFIFDQVDGGDPSNWREIGTRYPLSNGTGTPRFGFSVALSPNDGARALVGAHQDDTVGMNAGAVTLFGPCATPGTVPNEDGTTCGPCPGGSIPNANSPTCEACPQGTIANANATACESCPEGQSPNANQTACTSPDTNESSDDVVVSSGASALFSSVAMLMNIMLV